MVWLGCKVSIATSDEEDLRCFREREPDVVVLGHTDALY